MEVNTRKKLRALDPDQNGTTLVVVMVLGAIGMMVIALGIMLTVATTISNQRFIQGQRTVYLAETAAENALLRNLRDPSYTGETLTIDDGTATISVSGSAPKIFTITARIGETTRILVVQTTESNGIMSISSWKETF